jgi:hypothetical protein
MPSHMRVGQTFKRCWLKAQQIEAFALYRHS